MKKCALVTVLDHNEGLARLLCGELAKSGLEPFAHLWENDLKNMAWLAAAKELERQDRHVWIVAGQASDFADKTILRGLSLVALAAQAAHGNDFPILLSPSPATVDAAALPTPLRSAETVKSGLGAKAAVRANTPCRLRPEYRLKPHGLPGLGLWFEVGPAEHAWDGAFFACQGEGAVPDAHGVGPAGTIPSTSTLHYPVRDMRLRLGEREYTGFGVKNHVGRAESYYVRVSDVPEGVSFGPFPDNDEAELFTLHLC